MLTLQYALLALALAVATAVQRRLTRERIDGMSVGPHLEARSELVRRLYERIQQRRGGRR